MDPPGRWINYPIEQVLVRLCDLLRKSVPARFSYLGWHATFKIKSERIDDLGLEF
jgi:hypothetical protein